MGRQRRTDDDDDDDDDDELQESRAAKATKTLCGKEADALYPSLDDFPRDNRLAGSANSILLGYGVRVSL